MHALDLNRYLHTGMSTTENGSQNLLGQPYNITEYYAGLALAISSSIFIGSSFIIKKKALIRLTRYGSVRASAGGFGYLKEWIWWAGLLSMGIGETANFAAYAFAPASLVTPLGALSVLVSAVLASKFLNEKLNLLGKLGCFLCVVGSTVIVIHSPKEEEVENLAALVEKLEDPGFLTYVALVVALSLSIALYFGPLYGHRNVVWYIALCSVIGSLTVMSCKGLGLAFKAAVAGASGELEYCLTFAFIITLSVCIAVQMTYLNRSLDLFNTGIVTPIYYVFFTTSVICASAILFREWEHMSAEDILGSICGFLTVVVAIILLMAFKDTDISLSDVRGIWKPKRELLSSREGRRKDEETLLGSYENSRGSAYGSPGIVHSI